MLVRVCRAASPGRGEATALPPRPRLREAAGPGPARGAASSARADGWAGLGSQRIHSRWLLVPDHSIVSSLRPRLRPRSPGTGSRVTPRRRHDFRPLSRLRLLQPESRSRSQDVAPVPSPHTRPSLPGPGTGAESPPGGFELCPKGPASGRGRHLHTAPVGTARSVPASEPGRGSAAAAPAERVRRAGRARSPQPPPRLRSFPRPYVCVPCAP